MTQHELPEILFHDERVVVVNKPTGLLSVPGIGPEKADCVASRVATVFPGVRIVHRLDRDTSGVMVLALDAEAHRQLSMQFQERQVTKTYIALVTGVMDDDSGTVDLPMRKDMDDPPRQMIDHEQGRAVQTEWKVAQRFADRTRVMLFPHTGRSHQLRVHMKVIGHPILGDDLYAPPDVLARADRLMLHAEELTVIHPTTAELITFRGPCPF